MDGALRSVRGRGFLGVGRNPCRLVRHRRGDACGCHPSFLKGVGVPLSTPLCVPGETLGLVRAAASSSSHPFLKVLLWYAALRSAKSVVGILRRAQRLRVVLVFVDLPVLAFVSLHFLCFFLLGLIVLQLQQVGCIGRLLY